MARITRVKAAQQRYAMVPVLDEDGRPKRVPVMNKRTGEQKISKRGPVFRTLTVTDKSKPLPPLSCDFSGCQITEGKILVGQSYKHITPKSGPYGGTQRNRHAEHPDWKVWEYSYSVSAQAAQVQNDMHNAIDSFEFTAVEDFDSLRDEIAQMADDFVSERQDALDNMPEQLQDGSQASEYLEMAESWKDEIDQADAPDYDESDPECEDCAGSGEQDDTCDACEGHGVQNDLDGNETDCDACQATGTIQTDCDTCQGEGTVEREGLDEDWIEEAKDALREAVDGLEI